MPSTRSGRRAAQELASWLVLLRSGVFDAGWYSAQGGRRGPGPLAALDYVRRGRRAGLSPHPLVEPSWYRPTDWATRGPDPVASALRHPAGPSTHPLFDPAGWLAQHPEAAGHRGGPLGHFTAVAAPDTAMPVPPGLLAAFPGGTAPAAEPLRWADARVLLHGPTPPLAGLPPAPDGTVTVLVLAGTGWPAAWVSATSALRGLAPQDRVRVLVLPARADRADHAVLRALAGLDPRLLVRDAGTDPTVAVRRAGAALAGAPVLLLRAGLQLWTGWADAVRTGLTGTDPDGTPVALLQLTELDRAGRVAGAGLLAAPAPDQGQRPGPRWTGLAGRSPDDLRRDGPVRPVDAVQEGAFVVRDGGLLERLDPALPIAQAVPLLAGPDPVTGERPGPGRAAIGLHAAPAARLRPGIPLPAPAGAAGTAAPVRIGLPDHRSDPAPLPAGTPAARWVIRTAMPVDPRSLAWGDLHFARRLADALERLGRQVVVDFGPAMALPVQPPCDVELVLRGREPAAPRAGRSGPGGSGPGPVRLVWVISHPEEVTDAELADADLVFAASLTWARAASARTGTPVRPLLQATDPDRFHPAAAPAPGVPVEPVLFAGNSRGVYRPVVRHLVEAGVEVAVYGGQWEAFLGHGRVRAEFLPNEQLPAAYAAAGVVLNDHWEDMRAEGFVSNRLFDAAACGARVVSDRVEGVEELFGGLVRCFDDAGELVALVRQAPAGFPDDEQRRRIGEQVGREHSFDRRAEQLLAAAVELAGPRGQRRSDSTSSSK